MSIHEKAPLLAQHKTSGSRLLGRKPEAKFRLVIHGGAGTMDKSQSTPELRAKYKAALSRALIAGYVVLEGGGEAMDAAVAAVSSMEGVYPRRCLLLITKRAIRACRLSAFQPREGCRFQCCGQGESYHDSVWLALNYRRTSSRPPSCSRALRRPIPPSHPRGVESESPF